MSEEIGRREIQLPRIPEKVTEPYRLYLEDFHRLQHFVGFISSLATDVDRKAVVAAQALLETIEYETDREEKQRAYRKMIEEKGVGALKTLREFRQLILQAMVCRGVDNFLTYISQLLSLIFRTKPETLRSNDQIKVDFALQHTTMNDLVDALAEKKVTDLSYSGMRQLADYIRDRLGLELFADESALERAIFLIEVRNLITHNRSVVNDTFLNKLRASKEPVGKIGETLNLEVDSVFDGITFLADTVGQIDWRAASKFGLPQPHTYQK
jgi:hypothetical protein